MRLYVHVHVYPCVGKQSTRAAGCAVHKITAIARSSLHVASARYESSQRNALGAVLVGENKQPIAAHCVSARMSQV